MKIAKATVLSFALGYLLTTVAAYAGPSYMPDSELDVVLREKIKRDKWLNEPKVLVPRLRYLHCLNKNYFPKLAEMRLRLNGNLGLSSKWNSAHFEKYGLEIQRLASWIADNPCNAWFRQAIASAKRIGNGPEMAAILIRQTYDFLHGAYGALGKAKAK